MTQEELKAALSCVTLAIEELLLRNKPLKLITVRRLANQYGAKCSTGQNIRKVTNAINFSTLEGFIERVSETTDHVR
jgi:hypothetical protein